VPAKQKILVTGGAGYIGSHTVVALAEAGFEPVIVDSFANSTEQALQGIARILGREIPSHKADCTDEQCLREILKTEGKVAGAIHFAAYKAVGESVKEPLKYYQNNLGSLVALLNVLAGQGGAGVVFSSSATVYGDPTELPLTEVMPHGKAISPYAATKQMSEQVLQDATAANPALKASILRYFNPIGAHPSAHIGELPLGVPNNLVPFITQTAAGLREQLTVFGEDYPTPDGTCIRDYIHVQDLAAAHVAALHRLLGGSAPASEIINIGTGKGNSVLELIHTFEAVTGSQQGEGTAGLGSKAHAGRSPDRCLALAAKPFNR
jgi:UDP-glucose 4-epimerase